MNSLSNLEKSICLLFVAIFILWGGLSILMQEAFLIGRVSDRYVIGASAIRFGWFVLIGAIVFLNELMKFVRMRKSGRGRPPLRLRAPPVPPSWLSLC